MKSAQKKIYKLSGEAMTARIKGIFTMHGKSMEDIKNNSPVNCLVETKQIEKIIFL